MKAYIPFVFLCSILLPALMMAKSNVDSLTQLLDNTSKVDRKIEILHELSKAHGRTSKAGADYLQKMLKLAETNNKPEAQAQALNELGIAQSSKQAYEKAISYYKQALNLSLQYNIDSKTPSIYLNLGNALWRLTKIDSTIYAFQEAIKGFEKIGEDYEIWKVYYGLARAHSSLESDEQVSLNLEKAYDIVKDSKSRGDKGIILYTLASHCKNIGNFDRLYEVIQAWEAFQKEKKNNQPQVGGFGHISILTMFNQQDPNLVEKFEKAVDYYKDKGNAFRLGWAYFDLALALELEGKYKEAKPNFLLALEQYKIAGYKNRQSQTYHKLYQIEKKFENYPQALEYFEQHEALKDSLDLENMKKQIAELELAFETEKKERQIEKQNFEIRRKTNQRNIFISSSLLLILLALYIFFSFRNRMRLNKKIAQQEAYLQDQRIQQLEQEKQLLAFNYMLEGQEKERIRIAKDLHDSIGTLMSTVKAHFNALKPIDIKPKSEEIYSKTNRLIDDASVEIRRISHNMVPKALAHSGLKGALEDLVENLEASGFFCKLELINWEEDLNESKALVVFRIIQEISNNIIKHSEAQNVLLQLIRNEKQLSIFIEDDGKGFEIDKAIKKGGIGLQNINSRVQFLKGNIEWDTVLGEGTTVSVAIPIQQEQQQVFAA